MTHDANLPSSTPGSGVPESSTGIILQRGGEELLLEKVSDRFTVHPSSQAAVENLAEQIPAELHRSVPPAQSAEFIVDPAQRDQVMQAVRSSSGVDFASHVYRVKDNPGTLIYLTDKITIQFAPQVDQATKAAIATELGLQEVKPVVGVPNTFVFQVTAQATANSRTGINPHSRYCGVFWFCLGSMETSACSRADGPLVGHTRGPA